MEPLIGLTYIPNFLTPEQQATLLEQLRVLRFAHDVFRGQRLKRSYAQFGYAYVSAGRKLQPTTPFPDFLMALMEQARQYTVHRTSSCTIIVPGK